VDSISVAATSPGSVIVRKMWRGAARDVLAHLTEWQQMALGWYRTGLKGQTPELPAPGYSWVQLAQLNGMIYERHRDAPLSTVKAQFCASHQAMIKVIQTLTDAELFTKGYFGWTGHHTLGGYFAANTSSHYAWARNAMRKKIKALAKSL